MKSKGHPGHGTALPSARDDAHRAARAEDTPQTRSPSYRLAYADIDFLLRDDLRPVRLQLELLKPELIQQEHGIVSTVVVFGSTRITDPETARGRVAAAEAEVRAHPEDPEARVRLRAAESLAEKARYYEEARRLTQIISRAAQGNGQQEFVVVTGGGPGIMEAANRGAQEVGGKSIGFNIVLSETQHPNPYITPELSFQFHYFAIRKLHFLLRAKALIVFPGGFGTLDELFDALTLLQTEKVARVPVLLFGKEYWERVIRFEVLVEEGTIDPKDLRLFRYVERAEEAWELIQEYYRGDDGW